MVDQATLDKLEAGFQKLQAAADCKSLLKKYLTREVLDACKNKKTALGATLLDCIQSGKQIEHSNEIFYYDYNVVVFYVDIPALNIKVDYYNLIFFKI